MEKSVFEVRMNDILQRRNEPEDFVARVRQEKRMVICVGGGDTPVYTMFVT